MSNVASKCKAQTASLRSAMADFDDVSVRRALANVFSNDAKISMCYPFGELSGPNDFYEGVYGQLLNAIQDLERRELIVLAGTTPEGQDWVGMMGNYMGTFTSPFLDIPPTGHLVHMRFHEFYRLESGRVTEVQAIWDIPELMMQANAWPLAPQLGKFMATPGPMTQDGLTATGDGNCNNESRH